MAELIEVLSSGERRKTFHKNIFKGGSKTTATSKTERFVIIVNGFQLPAVNYYHKVLHLGCCSSPRSGSDFFIIVLPNVLFLKKNIIMHLLNNKNYLKERTFEKKIFERKKLVAKHKLVVIHFPKEWRLLQVLFTKNITLIFL